MRRESEEQARPQRRCTAWAWAGVGLWLVSGACGGDKSSPLCIPGETRVCDGPGACKGAQICGEHGDRFGDCDCGTPSPAASAPPVTQSVADALPAVCTPGATRDCRGPLACAGTQVCTSAGDGFDPCSCPMPLTANVVGAPCETKADCGRDLECWAASSASYLGIVGGPSHGYCTAVCAGSIDCASLDVNSLCWSSPGQQGMCVPRCLSKDPSVIEVKCLNRLDLTCWSAAAIGQEDLVVGRQGGVCLPSCLSDADCGGRFCNLNTGLCVDAAPPGAAIGQPCTLDTDCAGGLCLEFSNGARWCSAKCTYGSGGCGYSAAPREAVCAVPFLASATISEGIGDLGLCLELCDVDADCAAPGSVCKIAELNTGRAGACDASGPALADAGAPP